MRPRVHAAIAILLSALNKGANAINATLFAFPGGRSHGFVAVALALELSKRGHSPTIITWTEDMDVLRERAVSGVAFITHEVHYPTMKEPLAWGDFLKSSEVSASADDTNDALSSIRKILQDIYWGCKSALEAPNVQTHLLIQSQFIVGDGGNPCATVAAVAFNKSMVWYSPIGVIPPFFDNQLGSYSSALVPTTGSSSTDSMSVAEATQSTLTRLFIQWVLKRQENGIKCSTMLNMQINVSVPYKTCNSFLNQIDKPYGVRLVLSDLAYEYPRDFKSGVFFVGHPLSRHAREITDVRMRQFLDDANRGFVFISLGTLGQWNISLLPSVTKALITQLSPPGTRVLWKVNKDEAFVINSYLEGQDMSENSLLMTASWVSQNDVLGHKNCKIFVTHGGFNSLQEAAFHGVPVLGTPLLFDQFDNIARAVRFGLGKLLNKYDLLSNGSLLTKSINSIMANASFYDTAAVMKQRLRAHKQAPVVRAVDMIEYAFDTNGASFLIAPQRHFLVTHFSTLLIIFAGTLSLVLGTLCSMRLYALFWQPTGIHPVESSKKKQR